MPSHIASRFYGFSRLGFGAGLTCCLLAPPVTAQQYVSAAPSTSALPSIMHRVAAGETLTHIALRYLGDASLWPELQSHNHVPSPRLLQPGSVLQVPLTLMPKATASVDYVHGQAQRYDRGAGAEPITRGMPLQEGDRLQLDPDAFVVVRLADGSTIQVQSSSQMQLRQLRRRGRAGSLQSVLELQQGGLDVSVPPGTPAQRQLDVITPVATTSVRGTQFDVQQRPDGSTTVAVLRGRVAMQPASTDAGKVLLPHTGMAVRADGQASAVTTLLPAPAAQELPALAEDAQWLDLQLPAWPQAQGWLLSISTDPAGQQVLRNGRFAGHQARWPALPDGSYYLHARAIDQLGISGLPGSTVLRVKAHPVPPLVQASGTQAVLQQGSARLHCTPVDGATHYVHTIIGLADASADIQPAMWEHALLQTHSPAGDCSIDLSRLPAGHYAWRAASVRLLDGKDDQGPQGSPYRFRIAAAPAALSTEAIQVNTDTPYPAILWPAEPGQRFRLQAFAQPTDDTPVLDTMLEQPGWNAAGLPAGTWHIRIQVQDPSGLHSAFSPPRLITVPDLVSDGSGQPLTTSDGLGVERQKFH